VVAALERESCRIILNKRSRLVGEIWRRCTVIQSHPVGHSNDQNAPDDYCLRYCLISRCLATLAVALWV